MKIGADTKGVYAIAPTPFQPDGALDAASIDRMVDFYEAAGVDGLTILGIMGEAPKLEPAEAVDVVSRIVKRTRLPVIVGVSAPGFAAMRSLARASMDLGASAVMIAPVPSLRTDDQITGYFAQAAEAVGPDTPWVLQDYPLTLTVVMTPGVIRRIVTDNPACCHAQARGLARPREDLRAARLPARRLAPAALDPDRQRRPVPRLRDGARRRRRDDRLRLPRDAGRTWSASPPPAGATRRTTSSTRTCPTCATSSSRASASPSAST